MIVSPSSEFSENVWLCSGVNYHVLSVHIDRNGISYRLLTGVDSIPTLHDAVEFNVVDPSVYQGWVVTIHKLQGTISLEPASWANDWFWQAYFDGNPEAVRLFDLEKDRILSEAAP